MKEILLFRIQEEKKLESQEIPKQEPRGRNPIDNYIY